MEDYVRAHSAGSIVRSAFQIYIRHFGLLFVSALIPFSPVIVLGLLQPEGLPFLVVQLLGYLMAIVNVVPTTVLISQICVGDPPTLWSAYRRGFGRVTGRVLLTAFLVAGVVMVGSVLLVIPGIVFSVWFGFAVTVVVLERISGRAALARSRKLGRGYYLRNAAAYTLTAIAVFGPLYALLFAFGAAAAHLGLAPHVVFVVAVLGGVAAAPPLTAAVILLYYDMRVHKEAYDRLTLAEDLRR